MKVSGTGLAGAALLGVVGCGGGGSQSEGEGGGNGGETRTFSYAYDQPEESGYGIAARIFSDKLEELSNGTLVIEQFPGGQLGEEPDTLDSIRSGDIDFISVATANAATIAEQSGVFSLHFLFDGPEHAIKALADQQVNQTYQDMIEDSTEGTRMLTLLTQGLRDVYAGFQVQSVDDMVDKSIRIQATSTEQTLWSAYGAQTVNMPFGEVYTGLQTGTVDAAENSANNYLVNKHYEVAPIYSKTLHEANNAALFVSDQVWESLSEEEKGWVEGAAEEVRTAQPPEAFELDNQAEQKLRDLGVEIFEDVDRQSFIEIAEPVVNQLAEDLGTYAQDIVARVRELRS